MKLLKQKTDSSHLMVKTSVLIVSPGTLCVTDILGSSQKQNYLPNNAKILFTFFHSHSLTNAQWSFQRPQHVTLQQIKHSSRHKNPAVFY